MSAVIAFGDGTNQQLLADMQDFLATARRRLWGQRTLRALHWSAPATVLLATAMLAFHLLVLQLSGASVVILLTGPSALAMLVALRQRPSLDASARWLDKSLNGESGFSTYLEYIIERRRAATAAALETLTRWSAGVLDRGRRALHDQAAEGSLRIAALMMLAIALGLLIIFVPGRTRAAATPAADSPPLSSSELSARDSASNAVRSAVQRAAATPPPASGAVGRSARSAADPGSNPVEREPGTAPAAGARGAQISANNQGSAAGMNAALPHTAAVAAGRVDLRTSFRELVAPSGANSLGQASGAATSLEALSVTPQSVQFDREQASLARRAPTARRDQPAATAGAGPAATALIRRYLQLRDTPQ